jgi:hypothetical protein
MSYLDDYLGNEPIADMTAEQQRACEAATKLADPVLHDGLLRSILAALPGPPPWSNSAVEGAIKTALINAGVVDVPWMA